MSTVTAEKPAKQQIEKSEKFFIPDRVLIKPIAPNAFRLGLESVKEGFLRLPGTKYNWEPSRTGNRYHTGLEKISSTERAKLEKEIGHPLDYEFYSNLSYRMDGSNPNGHHMDLSDAQSKIVYLAMTESHLIASSALQAKDGSKPEAEWYIENKEAEAEAESAEIDRMTLAINKFGELSNAKKRAFCKIFSINVFGLSDKVAGTYLWKKITEKPKGAEAAPGRKPIDRFLDMVTWPDEKVNVYEEVEDAIASNILRRNAAQDFVYADDVLGSTKEQVISKLLAGENQGLRAAIKSKIALRI